MAKKPNKPKMLTGAELISDRDKLNRQVKEMTQERVSFDGHYKELAEFIDPRRGRFFVEDHNKGDKRFKNIINNKATIAARTATAGMLAGAVSPSRPWFQWTMLDKELMAHEPVKYWLSLFQRIILTVVAKSNFYNMAPTMVREMLEFGTGCMTHTDDFEDVARFYTHTVGSYYVAQNHRLSVNTLARRFQMTTLQMMNQFGPDGVSSAIKTQYDRSNYHAWHPVVHFIGPNPHKDSTSLSSEHKTYRSVYYEEKTKSADAKKQFLSRKGFDDFPAYVPRWELTGEDIYATNCPGMSSLGDIKQLQQQEKEKAKAIAKSSTPPLQGPASLRNQPIPNIPGGVTINSAIGAGKLEPLYEVTPQVQELLYDIQATEKRIDEGFFVPLFMAITEMEGIQPKNELQLSQINQERLLQLGPVLEQIHGEWLDRMVRRVAAQVLKAGIMPEAPRELQGRELDVEFVSALALAQRTYITGGIERTIGFAARLNEAGFDVSAKVNADRALEEYADNVGSPVKIIVPDEEAAETRRLQAEQRSQERQMMLAEQGAGIMKTAADSKLGDENVLSNMAGR